MTGYITAITPRRNYIIRKASNLSKQGHILAANLDQVCLVVTLFHPTTSTTFIDRFLATAEAYRVPAVIVINKIDLIEDDPEAIEYLNAVCYLYESIGYPVVKVSAKTGEGLDSLREKLKGKTTLFSGNSGVGKSTLIPVCTPQHFPKCLICPTPKSRRPSSTHRESRDSERWSSTSKKSVTSSRKYLKSVLTAVTETARIPTNPDALCVRLSTTTG